jgi:hypothetical protein
MAKVVQFISILPVDRTPHKVLLEVPEEDMPEDLYNKQDGSYGYQDSHLYVEADGKKWACRLRLIEK